MTTPSDRRILTESKRNSSMILNPLSPSFMDSSFGRYGEIITQSVQALRGAQVPDNDIHAIAMGTLASTAPGAKELRSACGNAESRLNKSRDDVSAAVRSLLGLAAEAASTDAKPTGADASEQEPTIDQMTIAENEPSTAANEAGAVSQQEAPDPKESGRQFFADSLHPFLGSPQNVVAIEGLIARFSAEQLTAEQRQLTAAIQFALAQGVTPAELLRINRAMFTHAQSAQSGATSA